MGSGSQNTRCATSYFYGVGRDKAVWRHLTDGRGGWIRTTRGIVTQVEVFRGIIYGLGTNRNVYRWTGGKWLRTSTAPVRGFVVYGDSIFGLGMDYAVWRSIKGGRYNRVTTHWVSDFAISGGYFYGVGKNYNGRNESSEYIKRSYIWTGKA